MKHYLKAITALICLLLVAGSVYAAPVRMFQNVVGESFQKEFYNPMVANGWADERGFEVERLGILACEQAAKANLVSKQDEQSCNKLFQKWNGLVGKFISVNTFKAKATGVGYWVGSITEMQLPLVIPGTVANKPTANIAVLELKEDFKNLSSRVGDSKMEESRLMGHIAKVSADVEKRDLVTNRKVRGIDGRVKSFENGNFTDAAKAAMDERARAQVDAGVKSLQGSIDAQNTSIENVKGDVAALSDTVDFRMKAMETAIEDSPVLAWGNKLFYAAGAFALLLIAIVWSNWGRTTAVKQEVKKEVTEVKDRLDIVEEQSGGRVDVDKVVLAEIVELVKQLNEEGKGAFQRLLTVGKGSYILRFTFATAGYVKVEGIKDQENAVHIDNLKKTILRAAGSDRIVGIVDSFSIEDDDALIAAGRFSFGKDTPLVIEEGLSLDQVIEGENDSVPSVFKSRIIAAV